MNEPRVSDNGPAGQRARVIGIMVTYRRQALLQDTLRRIAEQTYQLDQILVVDNENSSVTCELVERIQASSATPLRYIATSRNLGSAGGWAAGRRGSVRRF